MTNRPFNQLTACLTLLALLVVSTCVFAQSDSTVDCVLVAAEKPFIAMQKKDCPGIWEFLTRKTKHTIVGEIHAQSPAYSKEQIATDLRVGGLIAQSYWKSFLENFDPNLILNKSRWEIGFVKKAEALIMLTNKHSQRPAELKLYLEEGKWKVGLVESFWARKQARWLRRLRIDE